MKWWAHWPTFSIPPATQLSRPTRHIKTSSSSSTSSSLIQSMVIQNLLCLGERRPSNTLSDSDGRLFACVFKSLKCVRRVPRSGFCLLWAAAAAGAASGGGSTSTPEIYDTPVPGLLYSKQTGGGGGEIAEKRPTLCYQMGAERKQLHCNSSQALNVRSDGHFCWNE